MTAVFDISAEIPSATVDTFLRACNRYKDELGNSQAVAIRRGTIALVKSLRARTAKAKKQAPLADVVRCEKPRYLTPKGKKQTAQPAWKVRRHIGDKGERFFIHAADTRSDARKKHAQYTKFGLAKMSWGWFMKQLFNRAVPNEGNPRARIDDRMTNGFLREVVTGTNPRVEVLIVNKLDYIREALPAAALEDSMRAATASINAQIDKGLAKARNELG